MTAKPSLAMKPGIILALSLVLVRTLGITGVAVGTTVPMAIISLPLTLRLILRTFDLPLHEFVRTGLSGGLTAAALAIVVGVVLRSVWPAGSLTIALAQMAAAYAAAVAVSSFWWFSGSERLRIRQLVWPTVSAA